MRVDITLHTDEYVIREIDHDDSWDIGETGLEVQGVSLAPSDKEYDYEVPGRPGDLVVVLVEHYSDGCTFGSSEYAQVRGVFPTHEDAERFAGTVNTDHGYFGSFIAWHYFDARLPS